MRTATNGEQYDEHTHYQCEQCEGVFAKGWTDEEAWAETATVFPGLTEPDSAIVCDDCFKVLTAPPPPDPHPNLTALSARKMADVLMWGDAVTTDEEIQAALLRDVKGLPPPSA